jgi:antitoxin component of MazEF toxin-antitoxin module
MICALLCVRHWVEDCLAGNVRELNAPDKEVRVVYGTAVDISADSGKIVIHPRVEPEYRLEDLLKGVTKRNIHAEVETGEAVGREDW